MRLVLSAAILLLVASPARAHRLDELLQATRIAVSPDRVVLELDLTPGAAIAPQLLTTIDADGSGRISSEEARTYGERVLADLRLELNGHPKVLKLLQAEVPPVGALAEGEGTIRLVVDVDDASSPAGRSGIAFHNGHLPAASVYLVNALSPQSASVQIASQQRDRRQQDVLLTYDVSPGWQSRLPAWAWLVAAMGLLSVARYRYAIGVRSWRTACAARR